MVGCSGVRAKVKGVGSGPPPLSRGAPGSTDTFAIVGSIAIVVPLRYVIPLPRRLTALYILRVFDSAGGALVKFALEIWIKN